MAHAAYLREKARSMRIERRLTIDELAERLALPGTTTYYWVRDLPIQGSGRAECGRRRRAASIRSWTSCARFGATSLMSSRAQSSCYASRTAISWSGRAWCLRHGVLTLRVQDTLLRARTQAWMDCLGVEWQ
jgi:hypothetical protein